MELLRGVALVLMGATALGACAAPGLQPSGSTDGDGGAGDGAAGQADLGGAPDLAGGDGGGGCVLGSGDHCGACGTSCPPGADDGGTLRTCSDSTAAGACGIVCRGEAYDVDGQLANGCEAIDQPIQDSSLAAVAITLPNVANDPAMLTNPRNLAAQIYGDARVHESAPAQRVLGRDDWYKVTAVGAGDAASGMTACLGITNFPADDQFQLCISDSGQAVFGAAGCKLVAGGAASVCVPPPALTDAGTYYVRVHKMAGSNTANQYALFLQH